ncbi:toxin glutamine deamidase domain-containing protein [Streptomyces sp. NPDC060031]|uniref:toxin glutamine deamidase domain-containing protein n=1 Tax=Streptomyces sp. NPDC060031 TaxID=3347043 RepID=UPI0036BCC5FF
MAIQVPKDIVPFMEVLTGMKMPDGNEDKMFALAGVHHDLQKRLEALPQVLNDCVNYTANSFSGPAAQQYRDAMAPFIDSNGIDYIKAMSGQAAMIAEFTSETATQIQYVKYMIIAQCIELLLEMAIALALAFITGGASILEYLAGEAVAKFFMQNMIARIIGMIVMHEVISVGMAAAMDSMIQWIQLMEGTRDKFDTNSLIEAMKFGAIQGLIAVPMGPLGGLFGKGLGKLFGKNATKDIANIVGKAGGNKALGKDLGDVLGSALTRGNGPLSGAARTALIKDVGKAFADNVGTGAQKKIAREAGEKWAKELLDNFGKSGLPKSLRGTLDSLEGIISADLMRSLTRGLPDNLARDLLRSLGNHLGQGLTEGVTQVLAEGTYNAIFSENHDFESSWLTFGSGVVAGRLGHLAEAGGERIGLKLHEKAFGDKGGLEGGPPKAGSITPAAAGGSGSGAPTPTGAGEGTGTGTASDTDTGSAMKDASTDEDLAVLPIDEVTDEDWDTYWKGAESDTDSTATDTGAAPTPVPVPVPAPVPIGTASAPPAPAPAASGAPAAGGAPRPGGASTPGTAPGAGESRTTGDGAPAKVATTDTSTAPEVTDPVRPQTESDQAADGDGELQYLDVGSGTDTPPPLPTATVTVTETTTNTTTTTVTDPAANTADTGPAPVATSSSTPSIPSASPAATGGPTMLGTAPSFTAPHAAPEPTPQVPPAPTPVPAPQAPPAPDRAPVTGAGRWDLSTDPAVYKPYVESDHVRLATPEGDVGMTPRSVERWLADAGIVLERGGVFDEIDAFLYDPRSTPRVYAHDQARQFHAELTERSVAKHEAGQADVLQAVSELAQKITEKYPPTDYVYLGLGRSPAAVIAALQVAGAPAHSMPLSDFRPGPSDVTSIHYPASLAPPNGTPSLPPTIAQRGMLFAHFDEFVPEVPPGKNLVLIDYTQFGRSLFAAEGLLGEYFKDRGRTDVTVKAFAIHQHINTGDIKGTYQKIAQPRGLVDWYVNSAARKEWAGNVELFSLAPTGELGVKGKTLGESFKNEAFDGMAEFGSYKLLLADPATFEEQRPRRADGADSDGYHDTLKGALADNARPTPVPTSSEGATSPAPDLLGTGPRRQGPVPDLGDHRVVFDGSAEAGEQARLLARDYPWLGDVNPYRDSDAQARTNCLLTAIATDLSLAEGVGHQAPPSELSPASDLANYRDRPPLTVPTYADLAAMVHAAGPGTRGMVVVGTGGDAVAHVFNVVHDGENVVFLDGQTGRLADLPPSPDRLEYLPTTGEHADSGAQALSSDAGGQLGVTHDGSRWQQELPDSKEWAKASGRAFSSRSEKLAAIDTALAVHHRTAPEGHLASLGALQDAIEGWKRDKQAFTGAEISSDRAAAVESLHRSVDAERQRLTMEARGRVPGFGTPLPDASYDRVAVYSAGALTDTKGEFLAESRQEYEAARSQLPPTATEVDVRIRMLELRVDQAYAQFDAVRQAQENPDGLLGFFTAPEWYFKRPEIPFTRGEKEMIVTAAVNLSARTPGLLIVPGSTVWSEPQGTDTVIKAGTSAALNGRLVHETTKKREGSDVAGYSPDSAARAKLSGVVLEEAKGLGDRQQRAFNAAGDQVGDSTTFNVGNRRITVEICLDHMMQRAVRELRPAGVAPDARPPASDVQILLAHGAVLTGSVLRPGGIAIYNDATDHRAVPEAPKDAGAIRAVHVADENPRFAGARGGLRPPTERMEFHELDRLNTLDMGLYDLPPAAHAPAGPQLGSAWNMSTLSSELPGASDGAEAPHAPTPASPAAGSPTPESPVPQTPTPQSPVSAAPPPRSPAPDPAPDPVASLADDVFRAIIGGAEATPDAGTGDGGVRRPRSPEPEDPNPAKRPHTDAPGGDRALTGRGLVPPTPEQHRAVVEHVRALDLEAGERPPVTTGLLRLVDPTEGRTNCLESNLALWDTLDGAPRAAGSIPGASPERHAVWELGKSQGPAWHYGEGHQGLERVLDLVREGGPGTRALVLVAESGRVGHAVTLLHGADGRVELIDPQQHDIRDAAEPAPHLFPDPDARSSVWAHVRAADGDMLRGDGRYDEALYHDGETGGPAHEFGMLPGLDGAGLPRIFPKRPAVDRPEWNAEARHFERLVSAHAYRLSDRADSAVTLALGKLQAVLDVYYAHPLDADGNSPALQAFLNDDPTSAGQVKHSGLTAQDIKEMLVSGNPREKFTAFYNAAYYQAPGKEGSVEVAEDRGFKRALSEIMENQDWDAAARLGLDVGALQRYESYMSGTLPKTVRSVVGTVRPAHAHLVACDPFALGNLIPFQSKGSGDLMEMVRSQAYRAPRETYQQLVTPDKINRQTLRDHEAELSARELAFLLEHQDVALTLGLHYTQIPDAEVPRGADGRVNEAELMKRPGAVSVKHGADGEVFVITEMGGLVNFSPEAPGGPLRFIEGGARFTLDETRPWSRSMAEKGNPTVAGLSGTTTRMLSAFQWLNIPEATQADFVIGLIGWMGLHNDHSLYEILRGAQMAGFEGVGGKKFDLTDAASMYRSLGALGPEFDLPNLRKLTGAREELHDYPEWEKARRARANMDTTWDTDERLDEEARNTAVRRLHGLLPHEYLYRERGSRDIADGGFMSMAAYRDLRLTSYNLMRSLEQEEMAPKTANLRSVTDWLRTNNITARELRDTFTEAHLRALLVYTGSDHKLINMVVERTRGIDANLPVDTAARAVARELRTQLDLRLANKPDEEAKLFFADPEVHALLEEYKTPGLAATRRQEIKTDLHGRIETMLPRVLDEAKWHADMLADALRALPPVTARTAWRGDWAAGGTAMPDGLVRMMPFTYSGDTITYNTFASTSTKWSVAHGFTGRFIETPGTHPVLLELALTGVNGRDISIFSQGMGEEEILLMPGATFRIVHRQWVKETRRINGESVDTRYELIKAVEF